MHTLATIFTYYLFSILLHSQNSKLDFIGFSFLIFSTFFFNDSTASFYILCFSIIFIYKFIILFKSYPKKFESFYYFFISPDLYFAKQEKYILENQYDTEEILFMPEIFNIRPSNEYKAKAIISWNLRNLYFSIISFIIISLVFYKSKSNINFIYLFTIFFVCRTISRSIEIGVAFFKDITDSKMKNPFLNSNNRIKLASKSYIEIIFNFATLNFLGTIIYNEFKHTYLKYCFEILNNNIPQLIFNFNNKTILFSDHISISDNPIDILLKSFGITTFTNASVTSLSGIIQIMTTLILVLFALAGYLNNKGDNK